MTQTHQDSAIDTHRSCRKRQFETDVTEHLPDLRRYALSLTRDQTAAEDLVQDCVLRALARRHQFQPGTHLGRWLFTILRNLHLDACRKRTRHGPHVDIADAIPEPSSRAPQEDWMHLVDVAKDIRQLRRCDREVLMLSAFSPLSQKEIADRLDVAEGTVRSRLSRARATLAAHAAGH